MFGKNYDPRRCNSINYKNFLFFLIHWLQFFPLKNMLLILWSIKAFLFTNLIFMYLTIRNPEIVFLHADNCGYICFSLLGQILRYFTGMCTGCWYFVNDWRRHGLYWRKRSEHIRRTESSSCFGEVIASSISTVASSQILWFISTFQISFRIFIEIFLGILCCEQGYLSWLRYFYAWWCPQCGWCSGCSVDFI